MTNDLLSYLSICWWAEYLTILDHILSLFPSLTSLQPKIRMKDGQISPISLTLSPLLLLQYSFLHYSLCQMKHTINPLFFCDSQNDMESKIDMADHVYMYRSCKYAQIFWCRNLEQFLRYSWKSGHMTVWKQKLHFFIRSNE